MSQVQPQSWPHYCIGVVGNPNCGKTTLFNALTGSRQQVGNWSGVTVERKTGRYRLGEAEFTLVDLPGTYSLDVSDPSVSLDERIARDFVHAREADVILNILSRRRDPGPPATIMTPEALRLRHEPAADCARYDSLRRASG